MRLSAVMVLGVVALLVGPVVPAAPSWFLHESFAHEGWSSYRIGLTDDELVVLAGVLAPGEHGSIHIALFTASGTLVAASGISFLDGDLAEVALTAPAEGARILQPVMDVQARGNLDMGVRFLCDASCNPSRDFVLVAAAGGEFTRWGVAASADGAAELARTNGTTVQDVPSFAFDGVAARAAVLNYGAAVGVDAAYDASVGDHMVGHFIKARGAAPATTLEARLPGGPVVACPCVFGDAATYPSGAYTFRYEDAETRPSVAHLFVADVTFP